MANQRGALLLSLLLSLNGLSWAQSLPVQDPPAASPRTEQRIERITHEDAATRIDELRVGGDTKSITVSPKGGMPSYELGSGSANRQPIANEREAGSGKSGWKILGF